VQHCGSRLPTVEQLLRPVTIWSLQQYATLILRLQS